MKGESCLAQVNLKIDDKVKKDAEAVLDDIGISMTAAVTIFLKKVANEKKIPFELTASGLIGNQEKNIEER